MPTTEIIDGKTVTIYTPEERADGITKARLTGSIARVQSGQQPYADDADYVATVCAAANLSALPDSAADSYAAQYANQTITELEQALADAIDKATESPSAPDLPTPTVAGIPTRVSMRQARLALLGAGKLADVDAAIDAMPEPQKSAARIEWEYAAEVRRDNAFVAGLAPALGMTDAQVDALFVAAATL